MEREPRPPRRGDLSLARADCVQALGRVPGPSLDGATGASVLGERRGSTSAVLIATDQQAGVCVGTSDTRLVGLSPLGPVAGDVQLTVDDSPGILSGPGAAPVSLTAYSVTGSVVTVVHPAGLPDENPVPPTAKH